MKIRNGFVSNSSSSSFILGYGIIKDDEKFLKYCYENKITISNDINDEFSEVRVVPCWHIDKKHRILSCTNHIELIIPNEIEYNHGKDLIIVELGNDEGDGEFYNDDIEEMEWYRAENINFWSGHQRAIIELFSNKEIIDSKYSEIKFGAERNG